MNLMFWNKLTVALVEDDPVQSRGLKTMIEKQGGSCHAFSHAEELFNFLRKKSVDLIVMDMQLPGATGGEATQRIKFGEFGAENAKAIIVGISASEKVPDDLAQRKGAELFLRKPVTVEQLAQIIKAARQA